MIFFKPANEVIENNKLLKSLPVIEKNAGPVLPDED